jgi:hypothetical protein
MTPKDLPDGKVEEPYTAVLEAKEGVGPYTWSQSFALTSGTLPPGLSLGASSTAFLPITGTPTSAGQFNFGIKVVDANG